MNQSLLENNYLVIPQFIPFSRAKSLALSFQEYVAKNNCGGDEQIPESNSAYGFIEFDELLCEKIAAVGWFAGESVLPTYTYARVYHKNAELKVHKDRGACEVSLTLNLDQDGVDWPISIRKPDGSIATLHLQPGDAMLYLGCIAEHWREPFLGEQHTQVFLHYVRSRGPNAKFAFDKNRALGSVYEHTETDSCETKANLELTIANPQKLEWSDTHVEELSKYILLINNVLDPRTCSDILMEYSDTSEWAQAKVGAEEVERPDIRGAYSLGMSQPNVIERNPETRRALDKIVFERVNAALNFYRSKMPFQDIPVGVDSGYDLLMYSEGRGYSQHVDSFTQIPRALSCSLLLNTDFEGAEFCFFDGKYVLKPTLGSALFFPSNFQYPHQVNLVTKGTRYSIVTWFS